MLVLFNNINVKALC